jgi:LysM repeat protein
MNTPDNTDDKDFVMHDRDTEESEYDDFKNLTFEPAYELKHKLFSIPLIMAAVGFLILIILLIAVIFMGQDLADKKQIITIEERLNLIAGRLERLESSVNSKMDQIIKEMENRKQTSVQQLPPRVKIPQSEKKEEKAAKPNIHKVEAGDTLYKISKDYGLSIEQLRSYNQLGPNAKIFPGQELKLSP